jgi:hypothetical protein
MSEAEYFGILSAVYVAQVVPKPVALALAAIAIAMSFFYRAGT